MCFYLTENWVAVHVFAMTPDFTDHHLTHDNPIACHCNVNIKPIKSLPATAGSLHVGRRFEASANAGQHGLSRSYAALVVHGSPRSNIIQYLMKLNEVGWINWGNTWKHNFERKNRWRNARNALLSPLLLCLAALYSHIFTVPAGGRSRLNRGAAVVEVRSKRFASGHLEKSWELMRIEETRVFHSISVRALRAAVSGVQTQIELTDWSNAPIVPCFPRIWVRQPHRTLQRHISLGAGISDASKMFWCFWFINRNKERPKIVTHPKTSQNHEVVLYQG